MVDFVGAIATATQAVKLLNDLRGIDKAFESAESKLKIAELNGALADLKNALIDAKEEVRSKQSEFKLLEDNFLVFKETVEVQGFRYDKKDAERRSDIHIAQSVFRNMAICFTPHRLRNLVASKNVPVARLRTRQATISEIF